MIEVEFKNMRKNPKIIELFIDDLEDQAGIDFISIVSDPAIKRNFLSFKKDTDIASDEVKKSMLGVLDSEDIGESKEILKRSKIISEKKVNDGSDYLEIMRKMNGEFIKRSAIKPKENQSSFLDFGAGDTRTRVRFYYEGPTDSKNRDFCSIMMRQYSDKLFRFEDIMYMTSNEANDEFGYYDIFTKKGSYNCRHFWVQIQYQVIEEQKVNPNVITPSSEGELVNNPTQPSIDKSQRGNFKEEKHRDYPLTVVNEAKRGYGRDNLSKFSERCLNTSERIISTKIQRRLPLTDTEVVNVYAYLTTLKNGHFDPYEIRGGMTDEEKMEISCGTIIFLSLGGVPMIRWIESKMGQFSTQDVEVKKIKTEFQSIDTDKRTITGVAMIPNESIFRYDSVREEEYYVYFSKSTIRLLMEKFMLEAKNTNVDLEHNGVKVQAGVVECWIIEGKSDKAYELGFNEETAPVHSWMVSMKILDDELWDIIKNDPDNLNGFSVAGNFLSKNDMYSMDDILMMKIKEILEQVK